VRNRCLDEALTHIPDGIAGGMTAAERRAERRGRVIGLAGDELARQARTRADLAVAGAILIESGRSTEAVARICGVSLRTVFRWRARSAAALAILQAASCACLG
jgi:DNA invertase Pin-like site-specific DNA recombinase